MGYNRGMKLISSQIIDMPYKVLSLLFANDDNEHYQTVLLLDNLTPALLAKRLKNMAASIESSIDCSIHIPVDSTIIPKDISINPAKLRTEMMRKFK